MNRLILILFLFLAGCVPMPAKATYVKKLAKNHQSLAQNHHALVSVLQQGGQLTGPQAMKLLMDSAGTVTRAIEIGKEPASIGLPPGMGQVGKGLFGMLMGNPMALGTLGSGMLALLGTGGLALNRHKKTVAMNQEARDLRDADPEKAKVAWERSENFKS